MNLIKELRETACDAGNGLDRESRDAIYEASEKIETNDATIARVWKALDITTYEEAGGKEISEIVAEKVAASTYWRRQYDELHAHIEKMRADITANGSR